MNRTEQPGCQNPPSEAHLEAADGLKGKTGLIVDEDASRRAFGEWFSKTFIAGHPQGSAWLAWKSALEWATHSSGETK